jgi:hypothetical protein
VAELVFDDPLEVRRRFVDLLSGYWDEAFGHEWERLGPMLASEAEDAGSSIEEEGLYAFFDRQPELRLDREAGVLVRRSPHEHEVEVTPGRRLMLVPSAYVWPHVRVN